jgi:serine/threonine protein kinase
MEPPSFPHPAAGHVIDEFLILEQIGSGAFSRVHIAQHIPTGNFAAAKIIELSALNSDELKGMIREVSVFHLVSHPNICGLYRASIVDNSLILFMEFAPGGTLFELVRGKKGLGETEAQPYFVQLFAAVRHLHLFHFVAHRDLKLENVMLGKNRAVKLADFGLVGGTVDSLLRTVLGTPGFQAPEVIAGVEYNEKCDVWSLAVCLWTMVAGRLPFSTSPTNYRLFVDDIQKLQYPAFFSPLLKDLLQKMLIVKVDERPGLMALQGHLWLKGLPQLSPNIAPEPIFFKRVRSLAALTKLKRRKTVGDPVVIKQCVALGIDEAQLTADLAAGETTTATTTYFVLCNPISERPQPKQPRPEAEVTLTSGPPASADSLPPKLPPQLPPVTPGRKRDYKTPPGAPGKVSIPLPSPLIVPRRMSRPVCPVPQSGGRKSVDLGKTRKS